MANDTAEKQSKVIESKTLMECQSHSVEKKAKSKGLVAKIPVVIAEPKIQINVESTVVLENPAFEIKRIKKSLVLTQCELIPTGEKRSGKLFISGFVTKNIEYATAAVIAAGTVSGDIRHTTVNVPFSSFSKIYFDEEPEFDSNKNVIQVDILSPNNMESSQSEYNSIQEQRFNERVFCELVEASFREKDIRLNPVAADPLFPNVLVSDTFLEKMVIDITLKVLQLQQVEIPKAEVRDIDGKDDKKDDFKHSNNRLYDYDLKEESGTFRINW